MKEIVTKRIVDDIHRGEIDNTKINTNTLYGTVSGGSRGIIALGSAGSGTEVTIVTNTLASRYPDTDRMFAIHGVSFYQGNGTSGTGLIRGTGFTGTSSHWATEH